MQDKKNDCAVLTKQLISQEFANRMNVSKTFSADAVQTILDILTDHLASGGRIELRKFGVFKPKFRKELFGRNPMKPKDRIVIPAHYVVKFIPGKEVMDKLNQNAEAIGEVDTVGK